ncbi:MAG: hypothetical protein ACJ71W_04420 [Terriglobales bacterium]
MKEIDSIFEALAKNLNSDDDDDLWRLIVSTIMEEFARQIMVKSRNGKKCYLRVGACSHWIRPHQSRWTAAGGFAWPAGYKGAEGHSLVRGLPEFDWSEAFQFEFGRWMHTAKFTGKRQVIFRVAVPSRTTRHMQAAVHSIWSDSNEQILYGFRKAKGQWQCAAASDEKENGRVLSPRNPIKKSSRLAFSREDSTKERKTEDHRG